MKYYRKTKQLVDVSVGEAVRILRELQGMSQNGLSELTGIPQFSYFRAGMSIRNPRHKQSFEATLKINAVQFKRSAKNNFGDVN